MTAVQKLLDGGMTRKELFNSCEVDGVQPFSSLSLLSAWCHSSPKAISLDQLDRLDNAVDQMLWNRIDKARADNELLMKERKEYNTT